MQLNYNKMKLHIHERIVQTHCAGFSHHKSRVSLIASWVYAKRRKSTAQVMKFDRDFVRHKRHGEKPSSKMTVPVSGIGLRLIGRDEERRDESFKLIV